MKWKPALILIILIFSIFPIISVEAQEQVHVFSSKNVYESDLDLSTGELGLYAWKREASIRFRVPVAPSSTQIISEERVRLTYGTFRINIYELSQSEKLEYGGMEYEVFLESKPLASGFAFKINSENLNFYYQPPLTEELNSSDYDFLNATHAIIDGEIIVHRPLNVVGSYAVYHSSKTNNEYKSGKVFHIYRPKLVDDDGREAWASINIEKDTLTIILPQGFLDVAKYPVIVDPSFGYETAGGSSGALSDFITGSAYTCSASSVTAVNLTAYIETDPGGKNARYVCYRDSDDYRQDYTGEINPGGDPAWYSGACVVGVTLSNIAYKLGIWCETKIRCYYDTTGATGFYDDVVYDDTNPPPEYLSPTSWGTRSYSIYLNYTIAGNNYYRYPTQAINWTSSLNRQWELNRTFTQAITTGFILSRQWSLSRVFSQSLTFASNAYGSITRLIYRTVTLAVSWVGNGFRTWSLTRTFTQAIDWTSSIIRKWSLTRLFTQGISFVSNAYGKLVQGAQQYFRTVNLAVSWASQIIRQWNLTRKITQSINWASQLSRQWVLTRSISQAISFTSNAYGSIMKLYLRTVNLAVNWVGNNLRQWNLTRSFSQSVTWSSSIIRQWSLKRIISQAISFTSNAYGKWVSGAQQFYRTINLGVSWASQIIRQWSLSRTITQALDFTVDASGWLAEIFQRNISLVISFTSNAFGKFKALAFQVLVKTLKGISISNALVTVSNIVNGTIEWAEYTNITGYTSEYEMPIGNYSVFTSKEDYQPYNLLFDFNTSTLLEVPLKTIEEGIMIDIPMLVIFLFAIAFTAIFYLYEGDAGIGMISCAGWIALALYWTYNQTTPYQLAWIWWLMFAVNLILVAKTILQDMVGIGLEF